MTNEQAISGYSILNHIRGLLEAWMPDYVWYPLSRNARLGDRQVERIRELTDVIPRSFIHTVATSPDVLPSDKRLLEEVLSV